MTKEIFCTSWGIINLHIWKQWSEEALFTQHKITFETWADKQSGHDELWEDISETVRPLC